MPTTEVTDISWSYLSSIAMPFILINAPSFNFAESSSFCSAETIPISEVQDEIGDVVLRGKILKLDVRELKNEKLLYIFSFTDFTDTIQAKLFVRAEQKEELSAK